MWPFVKCFCRKGACLVVRQSPELLASNFPCDYQAFATDVYTVYWCACAFTKAQNEPKILLLSSLTILSRSLSEDAKA